MATVSIKNIAQAIYESSLNKNDSEINQILKKTVMLLNKNQIIGKSNKLLSALQEIIDKNEGIIRAKISTRSELKDYEIDEIKKIIKKKNNAEKVELIFTKNPKLLGGIKIEIGNEILDATLSNKIQKLQTYLIEN